MLISVVSQLYILIISDQSIDLSNKIGRAGSACRSREIGAASTWIEEIKDSITSNRSVPGRVSFESQEFPHQSQNCQGVLPVEMIPNE